MNEDLSRVVVRKPWGREYLCYRNEALAIWALNIASGRATSLHCHPHKNTALIVLDGRVEIEFIRGTPLRMAGLDKINVFRGRFHRTRAVYGDATLLEVEAPDDKRDIVRLEDDYGRVGLPIEGPESEEGRRQDCTMISDGGGTLFSECSMRVIRPLIMDDLRTFRAEHILVTLRGGLSDGLLPPGDAVDGETLARMAQAFAPIPGTQMLLIWRDR